MFIVAYLFVDLRISGYTLLMYKQMLTHKQAVKIRLKKAKNKEDLRDFIILELLSFNMSGWCICW